MKSPFVELVEQGVHWKEVVPLCEKRLSLVIHTKSKCHFQANINQQLRWENSGRWKSQRTEPTLIGPLTLKMSTLMVKASAASLLNSPARGGIQSITWLFSDPFSTLPHLPTHCMEMLHFPGSLVFCFYMGLANGRHWRKHGEKRRKTRISATPPCFLSGGNSGSCCNTWWLLFLQDASSFHGLNSHHTGLPGDPDPKL